MTTDLTPQRLHAQRLHLTADDAPHFTASVTHNGYGVVRLLDGFEIQSDSPEALTALSEVFAQAAGELLLVLDPDAPHPGCFGCSQAYQRTGGQNTQCTEHRRAA